MKVESQKSFVLLKGLRFERQLMAATLLAGCLGGAAAWATTGTLSIVTFLIVTLLGAAAQVGLHSLKPYLPWIALPLLVIAVYWTQAGRMEWAAVWPALIVAAMWVRRLPVVARFGNRGYVLYGILLIGVGAGGIPVWGLLCLLPAPLAWRMVKSANKKASGEWAMVTGMFLVAGYLVKGLIR